MLTKMSADYIRVDELKRRSAIRRHLASLFNADEGLN